MKIFLVIVMIMFALIEMPAVWIDIAENRGMELFEYSSSGREMTEVQFSLPGYEIEAVTENGETYQKISYWNEGRIVEIGKPDLPSFSRLIAIADRGNPYLQIIDYQEEIISDVLIYPQQELQSESRPQTVGFSKDENFYAGGGIFPTEIAVVGAPAIMRGLRVANLTFNPFRYDPANRELRILTNINIRLTTEGSEGENIITRSSQKLSRSFQQIYRATVLNYESLNLRDDHFQEPSYLFIHTINTQVTDALVYLTDWKHQKGFHVATQGFNSGTAFATIKAYIQNAYDTWENPPEFICLVGDAEGSFNIPTEPSNNGDHGYVRLDGTDILADAHIGRLSFNAITELQTIIYKILNYEKQPYLAQTDWYNKILLVGDPSSSGPSTIDVKQSIKTMMMQYSADYQYTEAYSGSYSSIMSNTINSGVSYFNYRGYLNMSGFGNTQINALTNGLMLPVAVFLTCGTGTFYSGDARSEVFLKAGSPGNPKGAIAAIGTATSSTHTMFNNCVDAGIFYGLFAEQNFNMGSALTRGKLNLYLNFPQNPVNAVHNFSYWNNLMGDPGMELWSGIPQPLTVNYDNQLALGTNMLHVSVLNNLEQPVENAWVTALLGDDDIFVYGYTDANGEVILNINAQDAGTATLTVTRHNFIPHLGSFDVGQAVRYVNVEEYQIDDDNNGLSSGNNNGIINPGETIELTVGLKNHGTNGASSVVATISSPDDFVTISSSTANYGIIASGATVFSAQPFVFSVAAGVLGGTMIHLQVDVQDNLGNLWTDYLAIPVQGANLYVLNYDFPGNPNGILEPGETTFLKLTVKNQGAAAANAVYGQLFANTSWFSIENDEGFFGNIPAGGQTTNSANLFELTAHSQIIPGSQFQLEVNFYNADGYNDTAYFLLTVGVATVHDPLGPDAYGYYCYDDGDTDYYNCPVYDWIDTSAGTQLALSDQGDMGAIANINNLPITFRFYGVEYNSLTVCSNGWISPGQTASKDYMNWQIPGPLGPSPMIAPFWDDLKTGNVKYLFNSALNYFVITWNMLNDFDNASEIFQAILYDANYYPTATGDSEIKFQYQVFNNTNSGSYSYPYNHGLYSTIGLEDHTGTKGLQYTFNNTYPTQAKVITNQTALLFTGPPIQFEEPYIVLGGVSLDDANGNGQADYGEDVNLNILLNNLGEQAATGVSATISATDIYVTLTQTTASYGSVPGSGSSTNLTPFSLTVAENCPDGHIVAFTINVTTTQGDWVLYFTLELNAPVVEFNSIFVDDGDNNILDPGETANIYLYFENNGGSAAYNLLTTLTENDPYITLNTSTHTFNTLNAGAIGAALINVTAASTAPVGHLANVNWEMSGSFNYTASGSFPIVISQVPVLMEENFSGTFPPTGWTITGGSNWQQGTGSYAGGTAPEARFYWTPSVTATQRLISYPMNTLGSSTLQLSFRHYLEHFSGAYTVKVQTTSNGNTWNDVWSIVNPNGNVGPQLLQMDVTTPDVGSSTFQIAWVFDGYSWNINNWYVDDIQLEGGQGAQLGFVSGIVTLTGGAGNVENVVVNAGNFSTSPAANGTYTLPLPAGTYNMTAVLDGYISGSQNNVNVVSGQTTTINFQLTALAAPLNLSASAITNDVLLEWEMPQATDLLPGRNIPGRDFETTEPADELRNLTGFKVYRNNIWIADINSATTMEYLDALLAAGDYSYFVKAVYDGGVLSEPSNTANVTVILLPPTNLEAVSQFPDVILNWIEPDYSRNLTGYRLYRDGSPIAEITETTYVDVSLPAGVYEYFVTALYSSYESPGSNTVVIQHTHATNLPAPSETALLGNHPNPFNPTTEISFALKESGQVRLEIFNLRGQLVRTLLKNKLEAGFHTAVWDGRDEAGKQVSSGVYFYHLQSGYYNSTKKMVMMK